jgi:hypothetical protein
MSSNNTKLDLSDDEAIKIHIVEFRTRTGGTFYEAVSDLLHKFENKVGEKLNQKEKHNFYIHIYNKLGIQFEI